MSTKHKKVVAVSGGFDPVHIGHVRLFRDAKKLGDELWVFLNSDDFLMRKKNYIFMRFDERKEILEAFDVVDRVLPVVDDDQTVCKTLKTYKPDIFANGGDRKPNMVPEHTVCEELGIEMVFGVGGDEKPQSSSWLVNNIKEDRGRDGIV